MAQLFPPSGGDSFSANSGVSYSSSGAAVEIAPGDISLAFRRGWTQAPVSSAPGNLDVPQGSSPALRLLQTGLAFCIAPTGSMANNGAITLGTALPAIYGNIYLYLPANAIVAGSAAGWYYAQMTSTTVGQVFNYAYTSGTPTIPGSPIAFATTGPGAYTGVTTAVTGPNVTMPANSMGPNGALTLRSLWTYVNSANNKTLVHLLGSSAVMSVVATTSVSYFADQIMLNRGNAAKQVANTTNPQGSTSTADAVFTVDTTADQTVGVKMTMATATEYLICDAALINVSAQQ